MTSDQQYRHVAPMTSLISSQLHCLEVELVGFDLVLVWCLVYFLVEMVLWRALVLVALEIQTEMFRENQKWISAHSSKIKKWLS